MGANGSHANGSTQSDAGQRWKTIGTVGEIQVIQLKSFKSPNKLPEESRTPNRIYAIFNKDGKDVKGIAKMVLMAKNCGRYTPRIMTIWGLIIICGRMADLFRS